MTLKSKVGFLHFSFFGSASFPAIAKEQEWEEFPLFLDEREDDHDLPEEENVHYRKKEEGMNWIPGGRIG